MNSPKLEGHKGRGGRTVTAGPPWGYHRPPLRSCSLGLHHKRQTDNQTGTGGDGACGWHPMHRSVLNKIINKVSLTKDQVRSSNAISSP